MSNSPATIRDVAERAGVSKSTASRVLSGVETAIAISPETRDLVLKAVKELRYRPHRGAQSLSGKQSHLLGMIVRETDDPWFAYLIDVISHAAKDRGYDLVLGNAERDPDEALALRDTMLDMRYCDGLLLCGDLQESSEDSSFLGKIGDSQNLVLVSRGSQDLSSPIPFVGVDNRQGTMLALDYLSELGHTQIACVSSRRVGDLADRVATYCEYVESSYSGIGADYLVIEEHDFDGGYRAARRLWELPSPPTAVFATADSLAIGVLCALSDMGITVPGEVSVVGFDDLRFSRFVRPALTTVHEPVEEIGQKAVELLLHMIADREAEPSCRILLEPHLVVRSSCGPLLARGGK